jgi:hypothetical protein
MCYNQDYNVMQCAHELTFSKKNDVKVMGRLYEVCSLTAISGSVLSSKSLK